MLEDKKLEALRNREFVEEYLYGRGISEQIEEHPRYKSILWKISNIMMNQKIKSHSESARKLLDLIISVGEDGSIIFYEGNGADGSEITCKYYIDNLDEKLKRIRMERLPKQKEEKYVAISVYDENGIEESLSTEQNTYNGKYFTKAVRNKNRIDIIKIETFEQKKDNLKKIEDKYMIRNDYTALEDIYPNREEIDPFDIRHLSIFGLPEIYRNLNYEEKVDAKTTLGKFSNLSDDEKNHIFKEYKKSNEMYGRIKIFEKRIANVFSISNQDLDK